MNDIELLELAAKAAGLPVCKDACHSEGGLFIGNGAGDLELWSPLTDDGDALRLAVKLKLQVTPGTYRSDEATAFHAGMGEAHERVHYQQDIYAATRRAIVRAAAAIGERMP